MTINDLEAIVYDGESVAVYQSDGSIFKEVYVGEFESACIEFGSSQVTGITASWFEDCGEREPILNIYI